MVAITKKTYRTTQVFIFGIVFYFLFMARVSSVKAATDIVNCATDLVLPNETYRLTIASIIGPNCIIQADNITIDGQGIYSITGGIIGNGFSFNIVNVPAVTGAIYSAGAYSYAGDGYNGGNITIQGSSILSAYSIGGGSFYSDAGDGGSITIINSSASGVVLSMGGYSHYGDGGSGGNITVANSNLYSIFLMVVVQSITLEVVVGL